MSSTDAPQAKHTHIWIGYRVAFLPALALLVGREPQVGSSMCKKMRVFGMTSSVCSMALLLVVLPEVLDVRLRQLFVWSVCLLPLLKSPS